jgi:beta-glucosidase
MNPPAPRILTRRKPLLLLAALAIPLAAAGAPPQKATPPPAAAQPSPKPTPKPRTPLDAVTPKPFKKYRHEGFLRRKAEGPIGLLFLGDSITDSWPRAGKSTWELFAPHQPANFGISAMRTEGLLWNITNGELDGIDPKLTVVLIGVNNIIQCPDEQPEWVAAGVRKTLQVIREKTPATRVALMAILPARNPGNHPARAKIAAANREIAKLADGDTVRFIDIGTAFLNPDGTTRKELMPDGLHPNARGYEVWYKALQPLLAETFQ